MATTSGLGTMISRAGLSSRSKTPLMRLFSSSSRMPCRVLWAMSCRISCSEWVSSLSEAGGTPRAPVMALAVPLKRIVKGKSR